MIQSSYFNAIHSIMGMNALSEFERVCHRYAIDHPCILVSTSSSESPFFIELCTSFINPMIISLDKKEINISLVQEISSSLHTSINGIIAVGEGSLLDVAKMVRASASQNIPLIGIPTTYGTGAESSSFAFAPLPHSPYYEVVTDRKIGCDVAIIDPRASMALQPVSCMLGFIASLGGAIDLMIHLPSEGIHTQIAKEGFDELISQRERIIQSSYDMKSRFLITQAAHVLGIVRSEYPSSSAHVLSLAISLLYRTIPYGMAMKIALPHIVRYEMKKDPTSICLLRSWFSLDSHDDPVAYISDLLQTISHASSHIMCHTLFDCSTKEGKNRLVFPEDLEKIADVALSLGDHIPSTLPKEKQEMLSLLEAVYWGYEWEPEINTTD